jgi:hypothetical protein
MLSQLSYSPTASGAYRRHGGLSKQSRTGWVLEPRPPSGEVLIGPPADGMMRPRPLLGSKAARLAGGGGSGRSPEWRNWYTQGTQNPPAFTGRVGSNPTSGTTHSSRGRISGDSSRPTVGQRRDAPSRCVPKGERHTMLRMLRSLALLALVLAAVPMVLPSPALAQYREFSGKVDKISEKKIYVDNRMGDKVSFVRVDETVVEGEKTEWDKIKKGDWVTVSWKFVDKPRKAYKVMVAPAPPEAGEDM